jgi:RES domain-containing protein
MSFQRPFDPELLDIIENLDSGPWVGVVWRQVFEGTPPTRPNQRGARWNPPDVEALYGSLDAATAAAEIDHLISVQPTPIKKPRVTVKLEVSLSRLVDLSDEDIMEQVGVSLATIRSNGVEECRLVGSAIAWLGYEAVLVPSARADGLNLVVFVNNLDPDNSVETVEEIPYPEPPD